MKKIIFEGCGTAIVTPFSDEGVNFEEFRKLIEFQIENEVDALIVCGTTGEASTMTEENCADYEWITRPVETPTTKTRLVSFMRFFTMILDFFTKLFKGELDFSNILG